MKILKKWKCEICGTEYADESKCALCEKSHKRIKGIKSARYNGYNVNGSGYPASVTIEFADGHEKTYKG